MMTPPRNAPTQDPNPKTTNRQEPPARAHSDEPYDGPLRTWGCQLRSRSTQLAAPSCCCRAMRDASRRSLIALLDLRSVLRSRINDSEFGRDAASERAVERPPHSIAKLGATRCVDQLDPVGQWRKASARSLIALRLDGHRFAITPHPY